MLGLFAHADCWGIVMKLKIDRIISIATLVASLVASILVLKKPAPVAVPQAPAAIKEHAESCNQKMAEFQQAAEQSRPASGQTTVSTAPAVATTSESSKP